MKSVPFKCNCCLVFLISKGKVKADFFPMCAVRIQDGMKEQFCCSLISTFDGVSGQLHHQIALLRGNTTDYY